MATKSTLESANIALKAQLAQMQAQIEALGNAPKTPKAEKPLVARGYFKRLDETTGKWIDDTTKPCIIISVPGAKPRKTSEENFKRELTLHDAMRKAYASL